MVLGLQNDNLAVRPKEDPLLSDDEEPDNSPDRSDDEKSSTTTTTTASSAPGSTVTEPGTPVTTKASA